MESVQRHDVRRTGVGPPDRLPTRGRLDGTIIAADYPLPVPAAACFVIGDVIFAGTARLAVGAGAPSGSRTRCGTPTSTRCWGPLFWPLYVAGCAWSYALTGNFGARNAFERGAGLADGGYADAPLRPAQPDLQQVLIVERLAR